MFLKDIQVFSFPASCRCFCPSNIFNFRCVLPLGKQLSFFRAKISDLPFYPLTSCTYFCTLSPWSKRNKHKSRALRAFGRLTESTESRERPLGLRIDSSFFFYSNLTLMHWPIKIGRKSKTAQLWMESFYAPLRPDCLYAYPVGKIFYACQANWQIRSSSHAEKRSCQFENWLSIEKWFSYGVQI